MWRQVLVLEPKPKEYIRIIMYLQLWVFRFYSESYVKPMHMI